jgi:hypothetical protein
MKNKHLLLNLLNKNTQIRVTENHSFIIDNTICGRKLIEALYIANDIEGISEWNFTHAGRAPTANSDINAIYKRLLSMSVTFKDGRLNFVFHSESGLLNEKDQGINAVHTTTNSHVINQFFIYLQELDEKQMQEDERDLKD